MRLSRNFFLHTGLVLLSILLSLCAAEILLRLFYPTCTVLRTFERDRGVFLTPEQSAICSNGEFHVRVTSNSLGFHDHEHKQEKPPQTCRILFLGDSLIEAVQVQKEHSITALTEDALNKKFHDNVQVLNFASSGSGPSQYLRVLEVLGLNYSPDVVVMWLYLGNDIRNSHPELQSSSTMPFHTINERDELEFIPADAQIPTNPFRKIFAGFTVFRLLREAIRLSPLQYPLVKLKLVANEGTDPKYKNGIHKDWYTYRKNLSKDWDEAYEVVFRILAKIQSILKKRNIPFIVGIIPTNLTIENRWKEALEYHDIKYNVEDWDFYAPRERIISSLESLNIDYLDLLPAFQEDYRKNKISHSWTRDAHWNERGHQVAADAVLKKLKPAMNSCFSIEK